MRKLVVACPFPVWPPRHGGQERAFQLFRALAPAFEASIVTLADAAQPGGEASLAPGVRELRVPMAPSPARAVEEATAAAGMPVGDILLPWLLQRTPAFADAVARASQDACLAVSWHSYPHAALAGLGLPVWYESQNFELGLKRALLAGRPGAAKLLAAVEETEAACARAAERVVCVSPEDAAAIAAAYAIPRERCIQVPNGTDTQAIDFQDRAVRDALRARLGIGARPLALFLGSAHGPNVDAAAGVVALAQALPQVVFVLAGAVGPALAATHALPANVAIAGVVDDAQRRAWLAACDLAVNPMRQGSGTSLKMLDYFAAGLPVITTPHGARGLGVDASLCITCEEAAFPDAISAVLGDPGAADARARNARAWVEARYDWRAIAARFVSAFEAARNESANSASSRAEAAQERATREAGRARTGP